MPPALWQPAEARADARVDRMLGMSEAVCHHLTRYHYSDGGRA